MRVSLLHDSLTHHPPHTGFEKSSLPFVEFKFALFVFCGNQVCLFISSSLRFVEFKFASKESSLRFSEFKFASKESSLRF